MNPIVAAVRSKNPKDARSDEQITLEFGDMLLGDPKNVAFAEQKYPDFVTQYRELSRQRAELSKPSIGSEFSRGVSSGMQSLKATAAGGAALAVDAIPGTFADPLRDRLLGAAQRAEEKAQDSAPTVPGIEGVKSAEDLTRYFLYGAGNVVPSLAEAAAVSTAGAILGSEVPVAGTAAGAVTGLIERQAVKSLIKKGVSALTKEAIAAEAKSISAQVGGALASTLNSQLLSSGEIYNDLRRNKNVDPDTAFNISILGGIVAAVPDSFLPAYIVSKYFGNAPKDAAHGYVARLAAEAVKTIPAEAVTEGFQELVNIAATKYADPTQRGTPLSKEEISRILNSAVQGGIGGLIAAPAAAIPGGNGGKEQASATTQPSVSKNPVIANYVGNQTRQSEQELEELATRELNGQLSESDRQLLQGMSPESRNAYTLIREKVSRKDFQPGVQFAPDGTPIVPTSNADNPAPAPAPAPGQVMADGTVFIPPLEGSPPPAAAPPPAPQYQVAADGSLITRSDGPEPAPAPPPARQISAQLAPSIGASQEGVIPNGQVQEVKKEVLAETGQVETPPGQSQTQAVEPRTLDVNDIDLEDRSLVVEQSAKGARRGQQGAGPQVDPTAGVIVDGDYEGKRAKLITQSELATMVEQAIEKKDEERRKKLEGVLRESTRNDGQILQVDTGEIVVVPGSSFRLLQDIKSEMSGDEESGAQKLDVVPGYYQVSGNETEDELSRRLVSESTVSSKTARETFGEARRSRTDTHRVTFFQKPDGSVVGLPTYSLVSGGVQRTYVANPEGGSGIRLSAAIKSGLAPMASIRLVRPVDATDQTARWQYSNREDFSKKVAAPALDRLSAAKRTAAAVEEKMTSGLSEEAPEGQANADAGRPNFGIEIQEKLAGDVYDELEAMLDGEKATNENVTEVLEQVQQYGEKESISQLNGILKSGLERGDDPREILKHVTDRIRFRYNTSLERGGRKSFIASVATDQEGRPGGVEAGQDGGQGDRGNASWLTPSENDAEPASGADPQSDYGAKNKIVTKEAYEEELAKALRDLGNTNAYVDPTVLIRVAKVGAFHLEAGLRKFGQWAERMLKDFAPVADKIVRNLKLLYRTAIQTVRNAGKLLTDVDDDATVDRELARISAEREGGRPVSQAAVGDGNAGGRPGPGRIQGAVQGSQVSDQRDQAGGIGHAAPRGEVRSDGPGRSFEVSQTAGGEGQAAGAGAVSKADGASGRPGLFTASQKLIPTPEEVVKRGQYPYVDDNQLLAINLALTRFKKGGAAFLLSDGTGVGKTITQIVMAVEVAKATGRPSLIVTQNEQIIDTAFRDDARLIGVDLDKSNVRLTTYRGISDGYGAKDQFGVVVFDEAHNLKNPGTRKSDAAVSLNTLHKVYATATPMDNPIAGAYFFSEVSGESQDEVAKRLGFEITVSVSESGDIVRRAKLLPGVTKNDVVASVILLRDAAIKRGAMIRREFPLYGRYDEEWMSLSDADREEQVEIEEYWQERIAEAESPMQIRNLKGQRLGDLSRWLETKKVQSTADLVFKNVMAGKAVIVMAEGINKTTIKGLGGKEVDGFITQLIAEINRRREAVRTINPVVYHLTEPARIFGGGDKAKEVRKFQSRQTMIAIATGKSGGAGISLDDTVGDLPRVLIDVTPEYSGDVFQQKMGRVSRRNTKSPAQILMLFMHEGLSDKRRAEIINEKLKILNAVTRGERDIDEFFVSGPDEDQQDIEEAARQREREIEEWRPPVNRVVIEDYGPGLKIIANHPEGDGTIARVRERLMRAIEATGARPQFYRMGKKVGFVIPARVEQQIASSIPDLLQPSAALRVEPIDKPAATPATDSRVADLYRGSLEVLAAAGVDVARFSARMAALGAEFFQREGGASFGNTIALVVNDLVNPTTENYVTLLHEVVHQIFAGESAERKRQIIDAVTSLADSELGLGAGSDPRISSSNPSGLSPEALAEERLAEALAQAAVDRGQAPSIAARMMAILKEIYYRAAMWIQRSVLGDSQVSPHLVIGYVDARLQRFTAGDKSFLSAIGGGKPSKSRVAGTLTTVSGAGISQEVYDFQSGKMLYQSVVPDSVEAVIHNITSDNPNIRYRKPGTTADPQVLGGEDNPGLRVGEDFAALNTVGDAYTEASKKAAVAAGKIKATAQEIPSLLGLKSTDAIVKGVLDKMAELNIQPQVDPAARIDDLLGDGFRDNATRKALRGINKAIARVALTRDSAKKRIEEFNARIDARRKKVEELKGAYKERKVLFGEALSEIRTVVTEFRNDIRSAVGNSRRLGILHQTLQQAMGSIEDLPQEAALSMEAVAADIQNSPADFLDNLAKLAKLPIDWQTATYDQVVAVIREAAKQDASLLKISDGTEVSNARLALIASVARSNEKLAPFLALSQTQDAEASRKLQELLSAALSDVEQRIEGAKRELASLPRLGKAAGKLFAAYQKERAATKRMEKRLKTDESIVEIADAFEPELHRSRIQLERRLGATVAPVELTHGAKLFLPKSPGDTASQVQSSVVEFQLRSDTDFSEKTVLDWVSKMEAWLLKNSGSRGALWNTIAEQVEKLNMAVADRRHRVISQTIHNQVTASLADQMASTGVVAGRTAKQRINRFTALNDSFRQDSIAAGYKWGALAARAIEACGIKDPDLFFEVIYDRALQYIAARKDLSATATEEEATAKAVAAAIEFLRSEGFTSDVMLRPGAVEAVSALLTETERASRQMDNTRRAMGLSVKDQVLGLFRDTVGHPLFTVKRKMSRMLEKVYLDMVRAGWLADKAFSSRDSIAAMAFSEDRQQLLADTVRNLFTPEVIHLFVRPLVYRAGRSLFYGPKLPSGVRPLAARADVITAFESTVGKGGSILDFASELHFMSGGSQETVAESVVETLDTFREYFDSVHKIFDQRNEAERTGIPMTPHQLMDARIAEDFPAEWLEHQRFDQHHMEQAVTQMAFHAAFGRDGSGIREDFRTVERELADKDLRYLRILEKTRLKTEGKRRSEARKIWSETAKAEGLNFDELESAHRHLQSARQAEERFNAWMRARGGAFLEQRAAQALIGSIAGLVVQGPKTSLLNLLSMFDPIVRYGISKTSVKQVGQNWTSFMGESLGTLFQLTGKQIDFNQRYVNLRHAVGRRDVDSVVKLKQRLKALGARSYEGGPVSSAIMHGTSVVKEVLRSGFGAGQYASFKPFAAFTQFGQWMHASTIDGLWRSFEDMVDRSVDYLNAHPEEVGSAEFTLTPEKLGYKRGMLLDDARTFEIMRVQMAEYGMKLEQIARDVYQARKADPKAPSLTREQYRMISQISQNEITLESNIATRPTAFYSNPVLKMGIPLLGWSVARMEQLGKAFREPTGERGAYLAGLKMFAAIMPVGLAFAWLMDKYDEELLGKKSNIRPLVTDDGLSVTAALEQLTRVGTFGLWGDVANTAVNFADGGDLRGVSLDSRVLFMNTTLNSIIALSTWARQGEATYSTVYRPLIQAVGGTGYLQYAQIINNLLSLDNAESRVTARINAQNYLRVAGRELGLEVRTGRSSQSLPTASRPWVMEMISAAVADDSAAFFEAYRKAVEAATEDGRPDPADYVRRAFQGYHPLRTVFKTPPSPGEYQRILWSLNDKGAEDVSDAVALINSFGQRIGIPAFLGREQKPKQSSNLRQSALMSLRQGSIFGKN